MQKIVVVKYSVVVINRRRKTECIVSIHHSHIFDYEFSCYRLQPSFHSASKGGNPISSSSSCHVLMLSL